MATTETVVEIEIVKIAESPANPRKNFGDLAELAASIRAKGVLVPVLVRPAGGEFELVYGARRLRASKLAGLKTIRAVVKEMTDEEAADTRLIENLQRQDISAIEEAESFDLLLKKWPAKEIAARVGKSSSYVHQRLQLVALPKAAREAVASGLLDLRVALAIARLAGAEQRELATKDVLAVRREWSQESGEDVQERMSPARAAAFIKARFTLRLKEAGFDLDDATLVEKAGACRGCPKRSATKPELFPELASKEDLCTDPDCFAAKREATWKIAAAKAEADGKKVLDAKKSKEIFRPGTHEPAYHSDLVTLDSEAGHEATGDYSSHKSWKTVLGPLAKELRPAVVQAPDGVVVEVISKDQALEAMRRAGKIKRTSSSGGGSGSDGIAADRLRAKLRRAELKAATLAVGEIVRAAALAKVAPEFWRTMLHETAIPRYGHCPWAARRMPEGSLKGLKGEAAGRKERAFGAKLIDESDDTIDLFGILVDHTLMGLISEYNTKPDLLVACCKVMKVDLPGMVKTEQAAVKAAAKEKAAAKKAKEKPAPKAKKSVEMPVDTCKVCGCTDDDPCDGGCGWVDHTHTLCSACVEAEPGDKPEPKKSKRRSLAVPPEPALQVGDHVRYQQGQGTFDALVTKLEGDVATLERCRDGKYVTRPASKVLKGWASDA